ncbi:MAG TPA: hypothetical protein VFV37_08940 [Luteibaculaceae bacterium]|nr:hypothetical protein [Luteibaculaceae bacterium]
MKKSIALLSLLVAAGAGSRLHAQNEQDIVNYTWFQPSGSARFLSMGGAFNALGGDMTSISYNPASTAVFLKNEISFSVGLQSMLSTNRYLDRATEDFSPRFNVGNFGIVSTIPVDETSNWRMVNLSYSYNRLRDFNFDQTFRGATNQYSLADQFAADANGIPEGNLVDELPLTSYLAYTTYLIDPDTVSPGNLYTTSFGTGEMEHQYRQSNTGRIGESVFSIGGNYTNKLYVGAGIGLTGIRHNTNYVYTESDPSAGAPITEFTYNYGISTEGSGVNGKFGVIYRATQGLRLAFSYQTPTSYRMNQLFNADMSTKYADQASPYEARSDLFQMVYKTITPSRTGLGVAYIFGQKGLISVDVNIQDYNGARFKNVSNAGGDFNQYDLSSNNRLIQQYLTGVNQIKVGGEYKFGKLSLRGGYQYQSNPIKTEFRNAETAMSTYSFGLGYAFKTFSIDAALSQTSFGNDYFFYQAAQPATIDRSILAASIGVVFRY